MSQMVATQARKPMQSPPAPASRVLQRKCDRCRKKKLMLQRTAVNSAQETVSPIVHEVLRSPGQPLDEKTRAFMEPRFGHDFSRVRVHTDAKAAESARAVNAVAYTVGRDVIFSAGQYSPDTDKGKKLMAHELMHVLQQRAMSYPAIEKKLEINDPEDENERQADRFADQVVSNRGGILGNIAQAQISLQRACGQNEIGIIADCLGQSGDVDGDVFHFRVNCDTFSPAGEDSRLRAFAATLQPDDIIEIHGFASIEGATDFNESLSCARAHKAESVLIEEGVSPAQIRPLIMHGATEGNATERRSVVIQRQTPTTQRREGQRPRRGVDPRVCDVLREEQRNGTWRMISRYNAITGDPPGRNLIVTQSDGSNFDLNWALDVAWVAGEFGGDCSAIVGSIFGRLGEGLCAGAGWVSGGMSYWFARLIGAVVEGYVNGAAVGWRYLTSGSVNLENLSGAEVGMSLGSSGAIGGRARRLRDFVHQHVLQECGI